MNFALPAGLDTLPQSEKGVTFPIFDLATQEQAEMDGTPITFTVKGSDSDDWTNAGIEIERRNRKKIAAGEKVDPIADLCEQIAAVTLNWTGIHTFDKKPAPCTAEEAAKLYRGVPAIRDQVYSRLSNRANFTRASLND